MSDLIGLYILVVPYLAIVAALLPPAPGMKISHGSDDRSSFAKGKSLPYSNAEEYCCGAHSGTARTQETG
jgi:hypothetical protein